MNPQPRHYLTGYTESVPPNANWAEWLRSPPYLNSRCPHSNRQLIEVSRRDRELKFDFNKRTRNFELHECRCQTPTLATDLFPLNTQWLASRLIIFCKNELTDRVEQYGFDPACMTFYKVDLPDAPYQPSAARTSADASSAVASVSDINTGVFSIERGPHLRIFRLCGGEYLPVFFRIRGLAAAPARAVVEQENDLDVDDEEEQTFQDFFKTLPDFKAVCCQATNNVLVAVKIPHTSNYTKYAGTSLAKTGPCECLVCKDVVLDTCLMPKYAEWSPILASLVFHAWNTRTLAMEKYMLNTFDPPGFHFQQVDCPSLIYDASKCTSPNLLYIERDLGFALFKTPFLRIEQCHSDGRVNGVSLPVRTFMVQKVARDTEALRRRLEQQEAERFNRRLGLYPAAAPVEVAAQQEGPADVPRLSPVPPERVASYQQIRGWLEEPPRLMELSDQQVTDYFAEDGSDESSPNQTGPSAPRQVAPASAPGARASSQAASAVQSSAQATSSSQGPALPSVQAVTPVQQEAHRPAQPSSSVQTPTRGQATTSTQDGGSSAILGPVQSNASEARRDVSAASAVQAPGQARSSAPALPSIPAATPVQQEAHLPAQPSASVQTPTRGQATTSKDGGSSATLAPVPSIASEAQRDVSSANVVQAPGQAVSSAQTTSSSRPPALPSVQAVTPVQQEAHRPAQPPASVQTPTRAQAPTQDGGLAATPAPVQSNGSEAMPPSPAQAVGQGSVQFKCPSLEPIRRRRSSDREKKKKRRSAREANVDNRTSASETPSKKHKEAQSQGTSSLPTHDSREDTESPPI